MPGDPPLPEAEDLLQTALAKCWSSWNRIEGDPESYVRRIIVNTFSTWWRRRWNGELPTEELPEPSGAAPGGPDVAANTDLWDAVGRLPKRQRAVIVLRFYEDLSEAATAELLGISAGTIKSQTAASSYKPAVLSNGVRTMVPPFVVTGTLIVVMTADGSYVERAKD